MFDLKHYSSLLVASKGASTNSQKGKTFEELSKYLFSQVDGLKFFDQDVNNGAEELDLIFWNAKTSNVFRSLDSVLLIECKNWACPANSVALASFISKVRTRKLKNGIFIAAKGVTGDFLNGNGINEGAINIIFNALIMDDIKIIVLRNDDLDKIQSIDDLEEKIIERICKLYSKKIF